MSVVKTYDHQNWIALINAISHTNQATIQYLLRYELSINDSVQLTCGKTGFTPLHIAADLNKPSLVKLLICGYGANVHLKDKDGHQPIHIACLHHDNIDVLRILLEYQADPNAVYLNNFDMEDCYEDKSYCLDEFRNNKLTLAAYTTISNDPDKLNLLFKYKADITIRSNKNKTLLMVALHDSSYLSARAIALKFEKHYPHLMHAHDINGNHALDYLLHSDKFGVERYNYKIFYNENLLQETVWSMYRAGVDFYDSTNIDPDRLLNIAAYRGISWLVRILTSSYPLLTGSMALHNALIPIENSDKLFTIDQVALNFGTTIEEMQAEVYEERDLTIENIIKDLVIRRTFNLPVPEEEMFRMDELLSADPNYRSFVEGFERSVINGYFKQKVVRYGKSCDTLFDLAVRIFNNRTRKLLGRNKKLITALDKYKTKNSDIFDFVFRLKVALTRSIKREELLGKSKRVKKLKKFIPLPYEIVLDIYDFLTNADLTNFIEAFEI